MPRRYIDDVVCQCCGEKTSSAFLICSVEDSAHRKAERFLRMKFGSAAGARAAGHAAIVLAMHPPPLLPIDRKLTAAAFEPLDVWSHARETQSAADKAAVALYSSAYDMGLHCHENDMPMITHATSLPAAASIVVGGLQPRSPPHRFKVTYLSWLAASEAATARGTTPPPNPVADFMRSWASASGPSGARHHGFVFVLTPLLVALPPQLATCVAHREVSMIGTGGGGENTRMSRKQRGDYFNGVENIIVEFNFTAASTQSVFRSPSGWPATNPVLRFAVTTNLTVPVGPMVEGSSCSL